VVAVAGTFAATASASARHFHYAVPVQASSPWPEMRRDSRNTGASPIRARFHGGHPWSFRTGRGIFSTPVIGGGGTVYVGSADHYFYALGPGGRLRWSLRTGGIIDAAAAIGRYVKGLRTAPITIGSGDERLYHLRTSPRDLPRKRRILWTFRPTLPPVPGQTVSWWEGNVAIGPGGTLYAGNTGGAAYAITPGGAQLWAAQRDNSVWTTPAFGEGAESGNSFWGSVDLFAFSLDAAGHQRWQTFTPGFVISSPAVGSDGTVYVGSFDHKLYALDPDTGIPKWSFATDAHIYSSPALAADPAGATSSIYIASADGSVYAVDPSGHLVWRYDTGDPVRSSPVIGRAPHGSGRIVYVGSSNGRLYALDAATGRRRWSFDTTPNRPALRDRNDLNASPALGARGVYIGSESGRVWFVPYDYCLHRRSPSCDRRPGQDLGANLDRMLYVTPGGSTLSPAARPTIPRATTITTRLVVRKAGRTLDAALQAPGSSDALVHVRPAFRFTTQLSGDGHYLFIRPRGFLRPRTGYRVRIRGGWLAGGQGGEAGQVDSTVRLRTSGGRGRLRLRASRGRVSAFTISRLAVPLPPILPSVNQIGFDSYDMIAGTISRTPSNRSRSGKVLLWVIGARRDGRGVAHPDPAGNFQFPLLGPYRGNSVELHANDLSLQFSFGAVPTRSFDLRGRLGPRLRTRPGSGLYSEAVCSEVPNYSVQLHAAGVCNGQDVLAVSGTMLTDRYRGPADRRPPGLRLASLHLRRPTASADGIAVARLALAPGARYPSRRHVGSILLTDALTGEVVPLDYRADTAAEASRRGDLRTVHLTIPAGTELPSRIRAYAIADVFPLGARLLR
jgi:outer membrane protein assembly factor BamB